MMSLDDPSCSEQLQHGWHAIECDAEGAVFSRLAIKWLLSAQQLGCCTAHSGLPAPSNLSCYASSRLEGTMEDEAQSLETPAAFLDALGDGLKGNEAVDVGLADILKRHILKVAPAKDAVALAKDAILKLAGERANPPKSEVANG